MAGAGGGGGQGGQAGAGGAGGGGAGGAGGMGMMMDAGVNAFTGAGQYAPGQPAQTAAQNHTAKGVQTPPQGDCLSCHNGQATQFSFAGTVYADAAGQTPAADVEIRAYDAARGVAAGDTHSDADGHFWVVGGALPQGVLVGARKQGSGMKLMMNPAASGSCDSAQGCHGGPPQGPIHL